MSFNTPIPPLFTARKTAIVTSLSTPTDSYKDASPKGSVDEGIRDLIDEINAMPGIVTTSSCAGRISVFLEGAKTSHEAENEEGQSTGGTKGAVPGGKGGGRWLFVSHEPISQASLSNDARTWLNTFGLCSTSTHRSPRIRPSVKSRLVRFSFEPMILHIMTASLHHAQPILAAAINAGFRESGVQSLKNLNDGNASPMVAVRTAGLGFESLIGFLDEGMGDGEESDGSGELLSLVDERYLELLLELANERFAANEDRIERFRDGLVIAKKDEVAWENADVRRERKRKEGLERKRNLEAERVVEEYGGSDPGEQDGAGILVGMDFD